MGGSAEASAAAKQWIRIDTRAFPVTLWIISNRDREMEVIVSRSSVSSVSHKTNYIALTYELALTQTISVALQMSVVEDQFAVRTQLVNGRAALLALKQLYYLAVCDSKNRRALCSRDVNCVVYATF